MQDVRLALRSLGRTPGFTITVVLTLALGIGANAALFRAVDRTLLAPLPYPEPNRLVALHETQTGKGFRPVSLPNLLDWRVRGTAFDAMAGYMRRSFGLRGGTGDGASAVAVIQVGMTTSGLFRVLGKGPLTGRSFTEREEIEGARLIVLSHSLWARQFNRNPALIGQTVQLNEQPYRVVGVLAPDFDFSIQGDRMDAFIPIDHRDYGNRAARPLEVIARLKPGSSIEDARAQIRAIGARLTREWPQENRDGGADLENLDAAWKGSVRRPLALLTCAALLLAAIALTNVVNLLLARAVSRRRETAIRLSLGAGFGHLLRQSLAESALLSAAGGLLGIALGNVCLRLVPLTSARLAEVGALRLDAKAVLFAAAATVLVGIVCGLAPALAGRKSYRAAVSRGHVRTRRGLVVAQVAASLILLLSAGLLLRVFLKLVTTNPGFDSSQVYYFGFGLPESRYDERRMVEFHRALSEKLTSIPGVESAGAAWRLPLNGRNLATAFQFEGAGRPVAEWAWVAVNTVAPGYFNVLRIPLTAGRNFSWSTDRPDRPPVVLVNRTFERTYGKVLGRRMQLRWATDLNPRGQLWEIVGVVADTYQAGLDKPVGPQVYIPVTRAGLDGGTYVLRSSRTEGDLAAVAARAVESIDPGLERIRFRRLDGWVQDSLADRRTPALLTAGLAGLALLLTVIGLYGMVAFQVELRRHEIAVRMALGADGRAVRRLVTGQGLSMVFAGTAIGLGVFAWIGGLLRSQLYGVEAYDPATIAVVVLTLAGAGVLACEWPARTAVRIEPTNSLNLLT